MSNDSVPDCYGQSYNSECEIDCPYSEDCCLECLEEDEPLFVDEALCGHPEFLKEEDFQKSLSRHKDDVPSEKKNQC